jgi:tetratricopeptide (TPR) repeat protein
MWYLVVPPIVVVLSLSFLLWYLSRKGDDFVIAEKVLESEGEQAKISFPRTKEFFLKILEKSGQHFKVSSLRMHNALHRFTQSVRASRVKVHTSLSSDDEMPAAMVTQTVPESKGPAPGEEVVEMKEVQTEERSLEYPILRKDRNALRVTPLETREEVAPRPMVSEVATHPEKRKRLFRPNAVREESLIARIARDPKDFTAYEELGDYYLEMENIKDAKECYRQVLKLSPVHRMVKIKIRRLEKLLTKTGE